MNVRRLLVLLFLLLRAVDSSFASETPEAANPFPVGENLTYRIYWGVIPVGETIITTDWVEEGGRRLIRIRLRTHTNKWMDRIHKIDDDVISVVEPGTLLPVRSVELVHDKDRNAEETTTFDHANRVAYFRFDRIMLPDSIVDEPGSHAGFVRLSYSFCQGIGSVKF